MPETSNTLSLSRTPSMLTTARLLSAASSFSTGATSSSITFGPGWSIGALTSIRSPTLASISAIVSPSRRTVSFDRLAAVGAVEDAGDDDLILADDAVPRRLDQFDAPLTLALMAGDQRMQRSVEAERSRQTGECRARRHR